MEEEKYFEKSALINELEINLWEMWSTFGRGPGCALHDEDDVLWFENPIPILPYNGILKFRVDNNINQRIDKLIKRFRERQVAFMWIVHPSSTPEDLTKRLERRGLVEIETMPGMVRSLSQIPEFPKLPEGMEVRKVVDEIDASEWYNLASWRWGVPIEHKEQLRATLKQFRLGKSRTKTHAWQVWSGKQSIAKAGLYVTTRSAGIYGVATKPEVRRRGLARILTITALNEAKNIGKEIAVLHSSPMAESLYKSIGFEAITIFRIFASEDVHL